ncbi:EAL domain-containing protein [Burkholderia sp. Ac-20345]|nr:EAL domain-containing protein [Burkholderia sp. Ac-20345]
MSSRGKADDRLEFLCRIVDDDGRHVSADQFVADVEASGLGVKIDRLVVRKVFERLCHAYSDVGSRDLKCASRNNSATSLGGVEIIEIVRSELKHGIIQPGQIFGSRVTCGDAVAGWH